MKKAKPSDSTAIRKLRKKFIIVTMLIMITTLGIPYVYDILDALYWEKDSTLYELEECLNDPSYLSEDIVIDDYFEEPVYVITLDKNRNIIDTQSSIKGKKIPQNVINSIIDNGSEKHNWKLYTYSLTKYEGGYKLAVINTSAGIAGLHRKLFYFLQLTVVLLLLFGISILLSRFVTKPAHIALDREKQFISDASHELKTPLSAISINAQALLPEIGNNRHLQNIISEADRMDELIKNLLNLSYLDERGMSIEKHRFNISQCCNEIVLTLESVIYERSISFCYNIAGGVTFNGNEANIKQVVSILLDNAMKHTHPRGEISFYLTQKGRKIIITVSNSGDTISSEDLPHIFERFYRVDKSRHSENSDDNGVYPDSNSNNYGLGLAIAKSIVDAHNGTISVSCDEEHGVTFTVELPA